MKLRTLAFAASLLLIGLAQAAQAHDGRGNGRGQWQGSRGVARYHQPVIVQRPHVIVVPAPRYSRHDMRGGYPYGYGYGNYGYGHSYGGYYGSRYGTPGYGWPGYVRSYPGGSLSLTLSLPLR